ncbi:MAG: glycosyltransferase family 39 protein [Novosphingobium sp.]
MVAIAFAAVGAIGNLPVIDDWSYGGTAFRFHRSGIFAPSDFTGFTLVTNILWSYPFLVLFGDSFEALRISSLVAALAGVAFTFLAMRQVGQSRFNAALAALVLAFCPLFFARSFSFMTDVFFTSLTTLAVFFYLRWFASAQKTDLAIAVIASVFATLSRQLGLFLPLAFGLTLVMTHRPSVRLWALAVMPLIAGLAGLVLIQVYLREFSKVPALYGSHYGDLTTVFTRLIHDWRDIIYNGFSLSFYLGLFTLPVVIAALPGQLLRRSDWRTASLALGLSIAFLLWTRHRSIRWLLPLMLPNKENLSVEGIGPFMLTDDYSAVLNHYGPIPDSFWAIVTALGVIGVVLIAVRIGRALEHVRIDSELFRQWRSSGLPVDRSLAFLAWGIVVYCAPLILFNYFDRYLLPMIPFIALCLSRLVPIDSSRPPRILALGLACVLLALSAGFSILGTREFNNWTVARWASLNRLMKDGVSPREIDGGFEFNGLYLYDINYEKTPIARSHRVNWWWIHDDRYMIAFGPMKGFHTFRTMAFDKPLTGGKGHIYTLQRDDVR